jgi:sugar lactone lactonase YvrE
VKTFRAEAVSDDEYGLGEGPFWDAARQRLLWVDINAGHVHSGELRGGKVLPRERFEFPGTVGAVVCSAVGELLVAGQRALWTVASDGEKTRGPQLIPEGKARRLNDGGCDPAGRFLVGSLALDEREGEGEETLVRVEGSAITIIDDDLSLSNGLAWSPDGRSMYSVDTIPGSVWIRDYQCLGPREEFLRITEGSPDGLCVDVDGNLWIAIWSAGQVRGFTPTGEHFATIEVAVPNTTSAAFVGPDLDTLVITTAGGPLFACDIGVRGLPVPVWAGR